MSHPNQPESAGLARVLGPVMTTAIVIGTIIGSGVFKKPAVIADLLPYSGVVAVVWVLGGVLVVLGALAYAEVAVLFPRTGGNYVFLKEAYGRLAGFLWGWVEFWIIRAASIAALATIFSESLHEVLRYLNNVSAGSSYLTFWQERWLTIGVILLLTLVNIQGVRWGGGLQFFITLVKMLSLLAILVLPFFFLGMLNGPDEMRSHRLGFTFTGLGTAFLAVLWPYHGWMNVAPIAGEVKEPQRNIPIAFLAGVAKVQLVGSSASLANQSPTRSALSSLRPVMA